MGEELIFEIGQGHTVTVRNFGQLLTWLADERDRWRWLVPNDGRTDVNGFANAIHASWARLIQDVSTINEQGRPLGDAAEPLRGLANGPMLTSDTADGMTVLDILKNAGDEAASFAGAILKRHLGPNSAVTREQFLGALLAIAPNLTNPVHWSEELKRERANFRQAARDIILRTETEAAQQRDALSALNRRGLDIARRLFKSRRIKWKAAQDAWTERASDQVGNIVQQGHNAVTKITETDNTYHEFMKLKAPVEYWTSKKNDHQTREAAARRKLYAYFPVTIILLVIAFALAGYFLLTHPDTQASKAPVALYVVVSGGLLLLTTMAFWVGRLLTKLYLSEHHLRNDAEERAVMTTTYLALLGDGGAAESDRQLVLAALFRPTPDGIVRDDGPGNLSIQALAAKFLTN